MEAKWAVALAFLGSSALAVVVAALALGRDDLPTVTYLVYTSEEQPLPRGGVIETRGGNELRLRFEDVLGDLDVEAAGDDLAGIIFDEKTFFETSPDRLNDLRRDGSVLAVLGVDAGAIFSQLDCPRDGRRSPMECDFILLDGQIGDPMTLDRTKPFLGLYYRDPRLRGDSQTLGWLQAADPELPSWLASWGERAIEARAFVRGS